MSCAALSLSAPRAHVSPLAWSGRVLGVVVGAFLALEALSRLIWTRALVAPSGHAPTLEPSLQIPLGAALLAGVGLYLVRPTRLIGGAVLVLCLAALSAVEAVADVRSPTHLLFWAYVAVLVVAGLALRRSSASSKEPS